MTYFDTLQALHRGEEFLCPTHNVPLHEEDDCPKCLQEIRDGLICEECTEPFTESNPNVEGRLCRRCAVERDAEIWQMAEEEAERDRLSGAIQ